MDFKFLPLKKNLCHRKKKIHKLDNEKNKELALVLRKKVKKGYLCGRPRNVRLFYHDRAARHPGLYICSKFDQKMWNNAQLKYSKEHINVKYLFPDISNSYYCLLEKIYYLLSDDITRKYPLRALLLDSKYFRPYERHSLTGRSRYKNGRTIELPPKINTLCSFDEALMILLNN